MTNEFVEARGAALFFGRFERGVKAEALKADGHAQHGERQPGLL